MCEGEGILWEEGFCDCDYNVLDCEGDCGGEATEGEFCPVPEPVR